jgi:hypothetical protein
MGSSFFDHLWTVGFALVIWYAGAICSWSLVRTVRTGIAGLPGGLDFQRRGDPVEFWFLTAINLIVVPGVMWLAVDSAGVRPDAVYFHLRELGSIVAG